MNGKCNEIDDAARGPFDEDLDRFLGSTRISPPPGYESVVTERVGRRKARNDRAFRGALCACGAVALSFSLWLGYGVDRGGVTAMEPTPDEVYVEIHVLEDLFFGAEALADDDLLDTLEFLMGG